MVELIHGPHVIVAATSEPVAIWSGEHRAWWRENRCGYTTDPSHAGLYSLSDAIHATHHVGPEKQIRIEDAPALAKADTARADMIAVIETFLAHHREPQCLEMLVAPARAALAKARGE